MRTSYTVTLLEEPPAAPFPALAKELRARSPLSPSLLLSTFVGLLLNKAKVRLLPGPRGAGPRLLPGRPPPGPASPRDLGQDGLCPPPPPPRGSGQESPAPDGPTPPRTPLPSRRAGPGLPAVTRRQVTLALSVPGTCRRRCRDA